MKLKTIAFILSFVFTLGAITACTEPSANNSAVAETSSASVTTSERRIDVHLNVIEALPENSSLEEGGESGWQSGEVEQPKSFLDNLGSSVVSVKAVSAESTLVGSGVVIASADDEGEKISYIITCHHLIQTAKSVTVTTPVGEEYEASFIGSDPDSDLCVMSIDAELPSVTIYSGAHDTVAVGETVFAVGYPFGTLGQSVTTGIISGNYSSVRIEGKKCNLLQTDAVVNEGNSGGGLFTRDGYLIGIVDAKIASDLNASVNGLNFVVPSDTMVEVSASLMETYTGIIPGYVKGKYNLGFSAKNSYVGIWGAKVQVYIVALDETGCLFKAGLKVNDRIESVEYKDVTYTVTDAEQFTDYINSLEFEIGDEVVFKVTRGETPYTIVVPILQYIFGYS